MGDALETTLDRHMALVALVVSKLIETGLAARDIDSERSKAFVGIGVDPTELGNVLMWMLDEGIIRSKRTERVESGAIFLKDAQLTAKGLAIIRQPLNEGDTLEERIQKADNSSNWSAILSYWRHRWSGSKQ
jgi:hypothetical protein